ncbi:hypothetical protein MSG28_006597 [Choristoneura fumiferana]|uniref:Uncharacterized protein n=1 Tax=Choristoneura fumiferana TaxID=7141 RepID=A0ACC0JFE2_CHOFU|nr:hypothetical protein MSG28_006597 [Choristoneura fumiferana]
MFAALQADLPWEHTEAGLYVMQAVAKNILPDEYEYVPKVVEAILSMPSGAHPASICKACSKQASAHVVTLLRAARQLDSLPLPHAAGAALVRALAAALAALPPDQLSVAMREAASIQLDALKALLKEGGAGDKPRDPCAALDLVAALFRDLSPRAAEACVPALGDDGRVMERACRALRFLLRCTSRRAGPLLAPLSRTMAAIYAQQQHSCLLYLASILVDELAHEPDCVPDLIELLKALMPRAFVLLQQDNGLKDNPDTVDDLFRLCIRFLQRIPVEFLSSGALPALVRCAALAAALDHRDANCSVMKFLHDLLARPHAPRKGQYTPAPLPPAALDHRDANCSVMKFLHDLLARPTRPPQGVSTPPPPSPCRARPPRRQLLRHEVPARPTGAAPRAPRKGSVHPRPPPPCRARPPRRQLLRHEVPARPTGAAPRAPRKGQYTPPPSPLPRSTTATPTAPS